MLSHEVQGELQEKDAEKKIIEKQTRQLNRTVILYFI